MQESSAAGAAKDLLPVYFLTYIFVWCRRAEEGLKEEREEKGGGADARRGNATAYGGLEEARTCPCVGGTGTLGRPIRNRILPVFIFSV